MSNWRDRILREFTPNVCRLTLVADPDGLLLEEGVLAGIHERGFELIPFEDHIAFRYAYESKFRSRWDRGEETDLVVVLRSSASNLSSLPHDLLQAGRQLFFCLGDVFPNLSYPIVAALDRGDLDSLYQAQQRYAPGVLGDNATKEFVLRHVFEIAPELVRKPSDLLRVLLRRHFREQRIPPLLDDRFIYLLRQQEGFEEWPLDTIVPDREAFFGFLQERWPHFLDRCLERNATAAQSERQPYGYEFPGPSDLPFDHDDIRVYIDNLFREGFLEPVAHGQGASLAKTWLAIGVQIDPQADRQRRVDGILDTLTSSFPSKDSRHDEWFHFSKTWGELLALVLESDVMLPEAPRKRIEELRHKIDTAFLHWLKTRYAGLANLPPVPPVMLHHIPRFLLRHFGDAKDDKVALVLVDGLSLDQWVVIRRELVSQCARYRFRERAVFAWIPTITSVSRQTAFAGKAPIYFPNSIHTTDREQALWTQFWVDQGLTQKQVAYAKGLGEGPLDRVEELVASPRTRVIGLVVDTVDKIMHGMQLGVAGMHNQVRQWAAQPFMANLLTLLFENGFRVYLTSDHGSVEATGCGRPAEGAVADIRGQRVRIYPDTALRSQVKTRFPAAVEWPLIGLPEGYLPLLAAGRSAFVGESERLVGHGGACLEEVVVPLIQIEWRDT